MAKTRIGLVSLGCPKNLVDSEEILGTLVETGRAEVVDHTAAADVLVVNTCAFIESAKKESIDAIFEALGRKERGEVGQVVVAGCLAQRYAGELSREIPEVDAFVGIQSAPQLAALLFNSSSVRGRKATRLPVANDLVAPLSDTYPLIPAARVRATSPWTAYLKISEGCDHSCTFCSIPSFRGRHRSKPLETVLDEAKRLVDSGVQEINLIAQDTTAYGIDRYKELALPRLLTALGRIDGLRWVRLLYCYPTMVTDRLIGTMSDTANIVRYIDIPLQHGDDAVLRRMRRGGSASSYHRLLARLRSAMPDIAVRTTFLVGFPGEDDAAFARLQDFVEEARFDRLGVFEYSPEEGTPGAQERPRVTRRVAAARRRQLLEHQQAISQAIQQNLVGKDLDLLVESVQGDSAVARSWRDAPEIDGVVRIAGACVAPGHWVRARVTGAEPYDLYAEAVFPVETESA